MKKLIGCLILPVAVGLFALCAGLPLRIPQPAPVIAPAQLITSTVLIAATESQGSGFIVLRGGRCFVWTAQHVIGEDRTVKVFRGPIGLVGKVILSDAEADIALLEIPALVSPDRGVEFYSSNEPLSIGTAVEHVGNPFGVRFPQSFSTGVVAGVGRTEPDSKTEFDQITCPAYPGCSGGGVYLADGRCVGMLVRQAAANLNFMIPLRVLRAWAWAHNVGWAI